MSNQILVLFGTSYGQTAKVARFIADHLTNQGHLARLVNADSVSDDLVLRDFDGVVVGASVIRGRHQRSVRRFVHANRDTLNTMPSAFFSVSGSAAGRDEQNKRDAQKCIDDFLGGTGWRPALIESVAGAMAFTKYNPFVRWMLKQISKRNGGPTDTSRDHEFTDWTQVQRFAEAFIHKLIDADAALLAAAAGARS